MEIIAKSKNGFLIAASEREVSEILTAVSGKAPDKLEIGQKIPAIDYASTITKVRALGDSYEFKALVERTAKFNAAIEELTAAVREAGNVIV